MVTIAVAPPVATTLSVTASPSQATAGTSITLTATVQSSQGVPTGTVTFSSGGIVLGSAPLNASGMAALTTTVLPVGTDTVTASFASTANYAPSSGAVIATIAVVPPNSYGISLNPTSLTLTQGQGGNSTLTITPKLGFAGDLKLQCVNAPADVSCTFGQSDSPTTTLALSGNGQVVNLNLVVATNSPHARHFSLGHSATSASSLQPFAFMSLALALWLPGDLTAWLMLMKMSRKLRLVGGISRTVLFLFIFGAGMVGLSGCAGGAPSFSNPAPSKETFTLEVTADITNGVGLDLSQSATLLVTVVK